MAGLRKELGFDHAGAYAVDSHSVRPEIDCHALGKSRQGALGHDVCRGVLRRICQDIAGGYEHDPPEFGLGHLRHDDLGDLRCAEHLNVHVPEEPVGTERAESCVDYPESREVNIVSEPDL